MAAPRDPYSDIPSLDPSRRATDDLNKHIDEGGLDTDIVILDEKIGARIAEREQLEESLPVESVDSSPQAPEEILARDARQAAPILETYSDRDSVRLLIFTQNKAITQLGSLAQRKLIELSGLFAEIHVIILSEIGDEDVSPAVRLTDNVWMYMTESSSWWKTGFDAYRIANEQLVFAGGFRADVIIAEDPFESGIVGHFVAKKYDRPFQVHILEDIFDEGFAAKDPHNGIRMHVLKYVIGKADCVRVRSEYLKRRILESHAALQDRIEVLPLYYNLESWRDMKPTLDLKERYPQFKFIILHISGMTARSHTLEVVSGAASLLRMYPTIGLVIVGSGPLRAAIEKQVIALGIFGQVEFEPMPEEVISHMKSANVLVHLSEDPEEDAVILEAASVKLPIIASAKNIAGTLLVHNESGFLCPLADATCVQYHLKAFLNDNLSRTRFAMNAEEVVFERIEQDYKAYLDAYRSSVERCI